VRPESRESILVTRVLLVDDHRIMRDGLRAILAGEPEIEVVGEAVDGRGAIAMIERDPPDVIVMDVGMPGMNGVEATRNVLRSHPDVRVVALSIHSDKRYVRNMLAAGASGYVLKSAAADELLCAVRAAMRGERFLSSEVDGEGAVGRAGDGSAYSVLGAREREVLQLLAEGMKSKAIGEQLSIAYKTVETHRRNIMRKLGIHSVAELTKYAVREGLTNLEG